MQVPCNNITAVIRLKQNTETNLQNILLLTLCGGPAWPASKQQGGTQISNWHNSTAGQSIITTLSAVCQSTASKYSSLIPLAGKARLDSYGSARLCKAQTEQAQIFTSNTRIGKIFYNIFVQRNGGIVYLCICEGS